MPGENSHFSPFLQQMIHVDPRSAGSAKPGLLSLRRFVRSSSSSAKATGHEESNSCDVLVLFRSHPHPDFHRPSVMCLDLEDMVKRCGCNMPTCLPCELEFLQHCYLWQHVG